MKLLQTFTKHIILKLLFWFLVISLIPLGFFGYVSYTNTINTVRKQVLDNLVTITNNKVFIIENYFAEQEEVISILVHNPVIIEAVKTYYKIYQTNRKETPESLKLDNEIRLLMEYFTQGKEGLYDFFLITRNGDVVFTITHEEDYRTNLKTGPFKKSNLAEIFQLASKLEVTEVSTFEYYPPSNDMAAFIGAPIYDNKEFIGVICMQIGTDFINLFAEDYQGLGNTGEIVLGTLKGDSVEIVAPMRHDPGAAFSKNFHVSSKSNLPIIQAAQAGEGEGLSLDYRGTEIFAVWRYLHYLNWGMVVKIDKSEVFAPIYKYRDLMIVIGIITVLIVLILAIIVSRSITRPIIQLTDSTKEIARGNLAYKTKIRSVDEIGILADSFNKMTEELKSSMSKVKYSAKELEITNLKLIGGKNQLEVKVEKRTKELSLKNIELERSQTAMLYMIEDLNRQSGELRDTQDTLIRSEKLAAIGQLAASVAHELRNPLGVMKNALYFFNMMEVGKDDIDIQENLDIFKSEIVKSNKIISDLLDFTRVKKPNLLPANINLIIEEVLDRITLEKDIKIITELEVTLPDIDVDHLQIHQVFYNIITNAVQEMETGGKLTIKTYMINNFLEASFTDIGNGISKENMTKIFEPLYSTKTNGVGLGLSICSSLIEGHGGKIEIESELGKGTTFIIKIPVSKR